MLSTARLRLVAGLLAAWAVVVGLRLAQVQLLQHEAWSREAAEQQQSTVEVEQPRGEDALEEGDGGGPPESEAGDELEEAFGGGGVLGGSME